MASSLHKIAANHRDTIVKMAGLRLSDASSRETTDYADIMTGDGVPSGAYGRASGTSLLYVRKDASTAHEAVYASVDGGTIWTALAPAVQTIVAATATAIPVTHSGSFPITQDGAETNTLAIPTFRGQTLSIYVDTDTSGARVITSAQRINQAGNTVITLTEVGDFIELVAISIGGALRWQVIANDGAVLS